MVNIMKVKHVEITLVKSLINRPERQKRTAKALGLRKINQKMIHKVTPQIEGMITKVNHLIKVEYK
jgi:large subunit ribosomal protein L30